MQLLASHGKKALGSDDDEDKLIPSAGAWRSLFSVSLEYRRHGKEYSRKYVKMQEFLSSIMKKRCQSFYEYF